jgi:hypothetical protein
LQRDYHIDSTPSTYLLDENGRVLFREDGYKPGDEKTIEAKIEAALNVVPTGPAATPLPSCPEDLQPSAPAPRIAGARPGA